MMKLFIIEGSEAKLLTEVIGDLEEEYYCIKFGVIKETEENENIVLSFGGKTGVIKFINKKYYF